MKLPKTIALEVKSLSNLVKRCIAEKTANEELSGLTGMQSWIIGYLYHHMDSETFQRDLEKEFHIRRSTATGILQLMEKSGLVTREPVEHDARLKKLTLTDRAVTMHEQVIQKIMEVEKRLRNGLSEQEIAEFFAIVEKIRANIE